MEVRAIRDSGDTSSRVGTNRICVPKSESSSARMIGRAKAPTYRPHPDSPTPRYGPTAFALLLMPSTWLPVYASDTSKVRKASQPVHRDLCRRRISTDNQANRDVLLLVTAAIPIVHVILPHTTIAKRILGADQHTDRRTCLFRGFRKIKQRMWPSTKPFGAGWSTSSVKSYETVPA